MINLAKTTAPKFFRRHPILLASKLNILALGFMSLTVGIALPVSALADNVTTQISAAMANQGNITRSDKAKAHRLLFQAAAEELRRNPHAADLPECATKQETNTGLCIRKSVTAPATDAELSGRNG